MGENVNGLDNPGDFWCYDRRCSGGDVNALGSLDESSSRYNYDCNSLCPGFDNITQLSCSKEVDVVPRVNVYVIQQVLSRVQMIKVSKR